MAIQLYKAGNSHTVNGIECEVKNFDFGEMELMLSQGWVKSPDETVESAATEVVVETSQETDTNINPVRLAAKEAGIDGWENKRIKTLEAELE